MITYSARRTFQLIFTGSGLLAMLSVLVVASYVYNVRFDLSTGARFTLSDHGRRVLEAVEQPIKVTAFIRTEDARNPILKDLLWQVSRQQPLIEYDVIDINRNPALASSYGVDAYGATVVESEDRRSDFSHPSEEQLTAAILTVLQKPKKVYALRGHGECSTQNTDRRVGCSLVREAMAEAAYSLDELQLIGGQQVPEDAGVVMILGPEGDLLSEEVSALEGWLDRGGDLLVLIDPFRSPRLVGLLGLYGIDVGADIVVEPEHRLAGGEKFSAVIQDLNRSHLVSGTLKSPPLFSLAATVSGRSDEAASRSVTKILKTGHNSWASHDASVAEGGTLTFVAGRDLNGPLSVGVEMTQRARMGAEGAGAMTRMIVYGDSDFATNRFLDYLGNKDLLVNSVNWLARDDQLIAVRPASKTAGTNQFFISQADGDTVFWASSVYQPLAFLGVAIFLSLWRRWRP